MADEILKRDQNRVTVLAGITNDASQEIKMLRVDPATGRLLASATGAGSGDVTGPGAAVTDDAVVRWNGTTGTDIQNSTVKLTDAGILSPVTSDTAVLGSTLLMWSDLFLASGAVINFNAGNATLTHSAGLLTSNVDIAVPDEAYGVGWNGSTEVPTKNAVYDKIETLGGGANTALSNLAAVAINETLVSDTDNTDALGTTAIAWSDLFLGSGGVITFNSAPSTPDITITHSADVLTFAGGTIVLGTATAAGGLTGNVTGNVSGTAATVTGAAQTAITSLGTLTALDVDNINLNGNTISATGDLNLTPSGGNQIVLDGTIEVDAGVVTGVTSLTIGGTVLTDNTITDDGTLILNPTTAVSFSDKPITNVGDIALDSLTADATTIALNSPLVLTENTSIALDPAGSADGKYTGITVTATSGYSQAFGDLVYLDPTDSRWEACDANAASGADGDSRGLIGMVVSTGTDGNACTILLNGIIRADAKFPTFTINNPIYVSETAAAVTQTQPTTTDVVIRIVGAALTADEMYFNPDNTWITHT